MTRKVKLAVSICVLALAAFVYNQTKDECETCKEPCDECVPRVPLIDLEEQ
jgi:hypothetical protein